MSKGRRYFIEEEPTGLFRILYGTEDDAEVVDWPPLATREEAEKDIAEFRKEMRELEAEEHSEALGLARMSFGTANDYDTTYERDMDRDDDFLSHYEGDF